MADLVIGPISWDRMIRAVEAVKERLSRAAVALERAGVPYAVVGGNAVAAWVSKVDEEAVRNTRDVDILLRRTDLEAAKAALASAGFVHANLLDVDMFLDGPNGKPSSAVHVLYAGEKVRPEYDAPTPDIDEADDSGPFRVVSLEALVRMKLTSFRRKDQVHVLDLIAVGLIDASWPARFPPALAARLQQLLADPDG